jgi:hypothetical protein
MNHYDYSTSTSVGYQTENAAIFIFLIFAFIVLIPYLWCLLTDWIGRRFYDCTFLQNHLHSPEATPESKTWKPYLEKHVKRYKHYHGH